MIELSTSFNRLIHIIPQLSTRILPDYNEKGIIYYESKNYLNLV